MWKKDGNSPMRNKRSFGGKKFEPKLKGRTVFPDRHKASEIIRHKAFFHEEDSWKAARRFDGPDFNRDFRNNDRKSFENKDNTNSEKKFDTKNQRDFGERRSFGDRERRSFGDKPRFERSRDRGFRDRDNKTRFGDKNKSIKDNGDKEIKFFIDSNIKTPDYMTDGATGMDIFYSGDNLKILPNTIMSINTGIMLKSLPDNLECLVRGRSGLSSKGLLILDPVSFSTEILNNYLVLKVINLSTNEIIIENGKAICQLVFSYMKKVNIEEVNELGITKRNKDGFGSTDTKQERNQEEQQEINEEEAEKEN